MTWKDIIRKAELPPRMGVGQPITNEYRQQMDNWAKAYENDVIRQSKEQLANRPDAGYLLFEGNTVSVTDLRKTYSLEEFANIVKRFVRDVVYNPRKYNYSREIGEMAKMPNKVVATLQMNSSYIDEFHKYLKNM
tara:strand:+ start:13529 stop:13933 length:405 start_codon:yes stop_codon:yes gene_type:complete